MDRLDYDGDALMFTVAQDHYMGDMFYPFDPLFNLLELDEPYKISRNASMTDSVVASTSFWLENSRKSLKRGEVCK